jgi:hypothetical protein
MDSNKLKAAIEKGAESLKNPAKEGQTHSRQTADAHDERRKKVAELAKESYEVVADYLFTEGYADSFESALIVADVISGEWFGGILEVLSPSRVAKLQRHVAAANKRFEKTGSRLTPSENEALAKIRARLETQERQPQPVQTSMNIGQEKRKPTTQRGSYEDRSATSSRRNK